MHKINTKKIFYTLFELVLSIIIFLIGIRLGVGTIHTLTYINEMMTNYGEFLTIIAYILLVFVCGILSLSFIILGLLIFLYSIYTDE